MVPELFDEAMLKQISVGGDDGSQEQGAPGDDQHDSEGRDRDSASELLFEAGITPDALAPLVGKPIDRLLQPHTVAGAARAGNDVEPNPPGH